MTTSTSVVNVDTATATLEERAQTVRRLHRRQKLRRGVVAAIVIGLISGVFFLGIPISRHMSTASYLRMRGMQVDWEIGEDNWDTAGATSVRDISMNGGIFYSPIGDKEVAMLSNLHRVESLELRESGLYTDKGMAAIAELVHLKNLNLARLNHLRYPQYYSEEVLGDSCLPPLQKLPRLASLDLSGYKITDAGLATLSTFPFLEDLDLTATDVTDAGLVHLAKLSRLKRIALGATRVTHAGLKKLQESRPELTIVTDVEATIKAGVEFWRKQAR